MRQEKGILRRFSDKYGYSPLISHQNSASNGFLKVHCSVESETISISFLYSATLISIWSILQFEWTFYPHMTLEYDTSVIWKISTYQIAKIFQMFMHFISPSLSSDRKVFKYGKAVKLRVVDSSFPTF